jgi:hypothetical protein
MYTCNECGILAPSREIIHLSEGDALCADCAWERNRETGKWVRMRHSQRVTTPDLTEVFKDPEDRYRSRR